MSSVFFPPLLNGCPFGGDGLGSDSRLFDSFYFLFFSDDLVLLELSYF